MTDFQLKLILLIGILLSTLNAQFMKETTPGSNRYNIKLPLPNLQIPYGNQPSLFGKSVYIAPTAVVSSTFEPCKLFEEVILNPRNPEIKKEMAMYYNINNGRALTCKDYFCGSIAPFWGDVHDRVDRDFQLQTYCTLCPGSVSETISGDFNSSSAKCKWTTDLCDNHCEGEGICLFVPFSLYPICYYPDRNIFLHNLDAVHLFWGYIYGSITYMNFGFGVLVVITLLFIAIPQFFIQISLMSKMQTPFQNAKKLFSLRLQAIFYLLCALTLAFLSPLLDLFQIYVLGGETLGDISSLIFGVVYLLHYMALSSVVILWSHLIEQSKSLNKNISKKNSILLAILYVSIGFLMIVLVGSVGYVVNILVAITLCFIGILLFVLGITYYIIAIKIYLTLSQGKEGKSKISFTKLRFTKLVMALNVGQFVLGLICFYFVMIRLIAFDILSLEFYLTINVFSYLWSYFYSGLLMIALFDMNKLKTFVAKILKKK